MIFIVLVVAIACIAAAVSVGEFWSFLCAFAAVVLGGCILLIMQRWRTKTAPFAFEVVKFLLTFLIIMVFFDALHYSGFSFDTPYFVVGFVAGVMLGAMTNILLAKRFAGGGR